MPWIGLFVLGLCFGGGGGILWELSCTLLLRVCQLQCLLPDFALVNYIDHVSERKSEQSQLAKSGKYNDWTKFLFSVVKLWWWWCDSLTLSIYDAALTYLLSPNQMNMDHNHTHKQTSDYIMKFVSRSNWVHGIYKGTDPSNIPRVALIIRL